MIVHALAWDYPYTNNVQALEFVVESSPDLIHWRCRATLPLTVQMYVISDQDAIAFYRVGVQPIGTPLRNDPVPPPPPPPPTEETEHVAGISGNIDLPPLPVTTNAVQSQARK